MKTSLIQIGNSRGVRIPKAIIESCNLEGELELIVEGESIILKPARNPSIRWDDPSIFSGDTSLSEEDEAWLAFGNEDSELDE